MKKIKTYFKPEFSKYPTRNRISLFLVRQVRSSAIFRTEGAKQPMSSAWFPSGTSIDDPFIERIVITKRKTVAVERRTGRELLREFGLLFPGGKKREGVCALNRNTPCGKCLDCLIYGFAAGGTGSRKSRVVSDECFSLLDKRSVIGKRSFNGLYDDGTMNDPELKTKHSTSLGADEFVDANTVFLDVVTLKNLTEDEFFYVLGNIMSSTRYGAISSRMGRMTNHLVGISFSKEEMSATAEWTQHTYDALRGDKDKPDKEINVRKVLQVAETTMRTANENVIGRIEFLSQEEVDEVLKHLKSIYSDEVLLKKMLERATKHYEDVLGSAG